MKNKTFDIFPNFKFQVDAKNYEDAQSKAYDLLKQMAEITYFDFDFDIEEEKNEEEPSCIKCGKIISIGESDDYGGMCATCWHERN